MTGRQLDDFAALTFHLPFTKMGKKALEALLKDNQSPVANKLREQLTASQKYCREVGNLYTGSLYLGVMSFLQNGQVNPGDRIGLFSYGSGAEGEFYSGILQPHFEKYLSDVKDDLANRHQVSIAEYEKQFNSQLGMNPDDVELDWQSDPAPFILKGQKEHKRIYQEKK